MNYWNAFVEIVKQYAIQSMAQLTGFRLWVAKLVLNYVIKSLKAIGVKIEQDQKAKEELKKDEAIINKPGITDEERRNADRNFFK